MTQPHDAPTNDASVSAPRGGKRRAIAALQATNPTGQDVPTDGLPAPTMSLGIRQIKGDDNRATQAADAAHASDATSGAPRLGAESPSPPAPPSERAPAN